MNPLATFLSLQRAVRQQLQRATVYLHKIDRLSFHGGDESGGHMSSKASRLRGGMALIKVRDD